ncbi:hypothetical protein PIB30_051718 [Stylosanthes scabra]|uniref:Uncharacterized protein n=1 Tax=Stylosanthes scabra TaxID=79078 RepID=A0ABU6QHJ8_9FABA|nr:hypothetical protein [Stylosanthes scabra]
MDTWQVIEWVSKSVTVSSGYPMWREGIGRPCLYVEDKAFFVQESISFHAVYALSMLLPGSGCRVSTLYLALSALGGSTLQLLGEAAPFV